MENTRRKLLENKIELVDEIIEEIIELPAESEGMNELPSYTEKNYRELSAVEKEDLINSLMKDDYLKYKNCYISRSKLLYDSSETLIKEISALSQLNELGYEIYLLPYSYARDSMNFYKKSADSITYGDFLELKSTISTNERAGQNCYEAVRKQADNIYISFVNDISEEKALKSIYGSIGNIKKGNRKHNIEDNFKGLLFLNFEKKGEIHLYDISKEGYVTKIENPSFENLKKILEDNKISQVIVNPSNERRSPRDLNLHQDIESVNNKEYQNFQDKKMENYVITQERNGEITVLASSYKNAIFVGGDYLSDYETYNLEKVNNLLKDLQESNPDNEYRIMTENDFRQTYLLDENKLTPTEYLAQKINASGINIHLSKEEMKAILDAGKNVQKMALQNVNFEEMTFYDFERNFEPKYKDYEIDCAGMGILSVQNKIEEIERRNNNTVLTVNASDGSAYHTYFDLNSWKEFKESVNSRGASITKVWVTEEFDRKKNEQAFYEKREEYWENKYKNENVQYMKSENGEVYGFTFDGEIYIDEDLVNSNVLAHEYTHIWDNYVQKNNPDLWQKGMNCLKGTSLWYEITEDKNYESLRTDDEILSECHARITGKMAEQVLERIAARDGELTKDKIIDWDREVNEYVATELLIKPELGDENYISESVKAEYLKEFLSMPMKDLMNEVKVNELNLNKKSSKPDMQIDKTSISSESPSFPVEPQLSLGSRANHILLENDTERQEVIEPKYSPSEVEWKKANAKMLNYVNTHSSKIQKYAETIDNSQTENPEESVEKSSKDIKPEISVVCGEIKSILGNKFTGGNIKLSQDFQHELIEKGLVNPEEEFVLINDAEAVAQGCKIKSDQPFVFLNIPVENNGKTDFVQTKYYHVSALEEPQKLEKNVEEAGNQNEAVDKNIIIYGETKVPEFAIITQHGLKTYSNLIIESYDPTSHSYLLQSEDGSQRLNITEETYNELMSNTFQEKAQSFTDDKPAYNKLLETQYNDYFKQRDNTAYNFKHNLSVYCRKEANSPCNALEIAKGIISRMSVEEKNKTKSLLQKMANGKTLNEVIVDIYHEAIKEVPLNEEYIKMKVPEKVIARPFYDTVSNNGDLVSKEHNLKIGDTLKNVNIKSDKLFGKGSENITFDELKIISSSKEGNCITLMDSNKSFVEIPLDTVLASYEKYKVNTQKIEKRNTVSMDISY